MKKTILFLIIGILTTSTSFTQTTTPDLGTIHNQVVDYLDRYDFTGKTQNDFLEDVFFYTGRLVDANAYPDGSRGIWGEIYACGQGQGIDTRKTYDEILSSLELSGKISASSKTFLSSLITQTENEPDYDAFSTKVSQLESSYNISGLPQDERIIVEGSLSVFKSSAAYWNNYYDSTETTPEPQGRFSWRCFGCVAIHDIAGAGLGFLVGNCLCGKLGAPNPAICGVVGAAALGALYSWAAKVCPDVCNRCKKPNPNSYPAWICHLPFLYW